MISYNAATKKIVNNLEKKLTKACIMVEASAIEKCPVDTGHLRNSITHRVSRDFKGNLIGFIGTNVEYAPYLHEGTGIYAKNGMGRKTGWFWTGTTPKWKGTFFTQGQKPKPFLQEAIDENRNKITKMLGGK